MYSDFNLIIEELHVGWFVVFFIEKWVVDISKIYYK